MVTTTSGRVRTAALVFAVLAAGLTACTDDEPPTEPDGSPSSSATESEPTPSGEPTDDPSTAAPAGEKRTVGSLTLTFPEDWDVERVTDDVVDATGPDPVADRISVVASTAYTVRPLDDIAESTRNDVSWQGQPTREPDLEVDGVDMLHWSGTSVLDARADIVVGVSSGYQVEVIVQSGLPRADHRALLEAVLAGFRWE